MALTDAQKVMWYAVGDSASSLASADCIALAIENQAGNLKLAAAEVCDALAGDAARQAQTQSSGQFSTSTAPVAEQLREQAKRLRDEVESEPYSAEFENYTYPWRNEVLEDVDG